MNARQWFERGGEGFTAHAIVLFSLDRLPRPSSLDLRLDRVPPMWRAGIVADSPCPALRSAAVGEPPRRLCLPVLLPLPAPVWSIVAVRVKFISPVAAPSRARNSNTGKYRPSEQRGVIQ